MIFSCPNFKKFIISYCFINTLIIINIPILARYSFKISFILPDNFDANFNQILLKNSYLVSNNNCYSSNNDYYLQVFDLCAGKMFHVYFWKYFFNLYFLIKI